MIEARRGKKSEDKQSSLVLDEDYNFHKSLLSDSRAESKSLPIFRWRDCGGVLKILVSLVAKSIKL